MVFTDPTVSVVVPAMNEGPDLEATIALLAASDPQPFEVIVVDDCSREPVEPRLWALKRQCNLRVIRNERRMGSGKSKSIGLDAATGDILCVMDSHMRPPWDWLTYVKQTFIQFPYSCLCPWSVGFAYRSKFMGYGAKFLPSRHGYWDMAWQPWSGPGTPPRGHVVPCILGGCYIFGRELMHHIGGYNRDHVGWGNEQEFVSLRAWIAGFDCRLIDFAMPHHYARENHKADRVDAHGTPSNNWEVWHNRHFMARTCFADGVFERIYGPLSKGHYWPDGLRRAVEASLPAVKRMRAHIAGIRLRSDAEVAALVGMRDCQTREEYLEYAIKDGRKPKVAKPAEAVAA
jgi:glycosyltransferase involved in cell wall biosynthesis